jgi:hypothetical protein
MSWVAPTVVTAIAIWHVRALLRAGNAVAMPAGIMWALALASTIGWLGGPEIPSPLVVLDRLFRGLTTVLRTL